MHICPVEICAILGILPLLGLIRPCCREFLDRWHKHFKRHK